MFFTSIAEVIDRKVITGVEDTVERVSKIGSASSQVLTLGADDLLSFCHEGTAKVVDGQTVETD
jgi:hypothetical protein